MREARGNVGEIQLALDAGVHVDQTDDRNMTSLMFAAAYGDLPAVKLLLANKADPAHKDNHYRTALDIATLLGYTDVAKELLSFVQKVRLCICLD